MPTNYLASNLNGVLLDFETILAIRPRNYLKMDYVHVKNTLFYIQHYLPIKESTVHFIAQRIGNFFQIPLKQQNA